MQIIKDENASSLTSFSILPFLPRLILDSRFLLTRVFPVCPRFLPHNHQLSILFLFDDILQLLGKTQTYLPRLQCLRALAFLLFFFSYFLGLTAVSQPTTTLPSFQSPDSMQFDYFSFCTQKSSLFHSSFLKGLSHNLM